MQERIETNKPEIPGDIIGKIDFANDIYKKCFVPGLKKPERIELINQYNEVAKQVNKIKGHYGLTLITIKTKPEPEIEPALRHPDQSENNYRIQQNLNDEPVMTGVQKVQKIREEKIIRETTKKVIKKLTFTPSTKSLPAGTTLNVKPGSKSEQILLLHIAGKSNKEIIDLGFSANTVRDQIYKFKNHPQGYKPPHQR